jgi:hypothetical protein
MVLLVKGYFSSEIGLGSYAGKMRVIDDSSQHATVSIEEASEVLELKWNRYKKANF